MLCAEARTPAIRGSNDQRQRHLAISHVARLGHLVRDHVPARREEVREHDLDDGPKPRHRRAHRRSDDRLLRDRSVAHTLRSKPLKQSDSGFENTAGGSHVLAYEVDHRVALHLLRDAGRYRFAKRQFRHAEPPSLQTWLSMSSTRASGAFRASSVARSTLRRASSSIFCSTRSSIPRDASLSRYCWTGSRLIHSRTSSFGR